MPPRSKGLGYAGFLILIGCFLLIRPLIEHLESSSEAMLRRHIGAAVFATAGVLTFGLAAFLDKKSGPEVFSKSAWSSEILDSQHIMLYLPLRLIGVLYFALSFIF